MNGRDGYRMVEAMSVDALGNLVRNPFALAEIGLLARFADLTAELAELGRRELPVLVLTTDSDGVIPMASFDALCAAIGTDRTVVDGGHSWLLARPGAFAEVLENVVQVQADRDEADGIVTTAEQLRRLLRHTTVPARAVASLVRGASPLWLMSEPVASLAGDLAICHPTLAAGRSGPSPDPAAIPASTGSPSSPPTGPDSSPTPPPPSPRPGSRSGRRRRRRGTTWHCTR